MVDSTVAGVASLAGIKAGLWKGKNLAKMRKVDKSFKPKMTAKKVQECYRGWQKAVGQATFLAKD